MKQFFEGFRKWSVLTEEQLLAEGRLEDTKKKFKNIDPDWIDRMSDRDPSGNNKYLMWAIKQFAKISEPYMKNKPAEGESWSTEDSQGIYQAYMAVADAMEKFHNNSQRLKNRDINAYKTIDDVISAVKKLGLSQKQKRRKKREQAKEGSTVIEETDDFWMIRPDTTEASCYYGQGTKWCISATQSRNYFKQYTQEGKVFYMLMLKNLDDDDDGKKLALVYSRDYEDEPEEIYDAADDAIDEDDFLEHIISNFIAREFADYEKVKKEYDEFHEDPSEETLTDNVKKIARELVNAGPEYDPDIDEDEIEDPELIDQLDENMRMAFHNAKYNIFTQAGYHAQANPGGPSYEDYEDMLSNYSFEDISVSFDEYDAGQFWWDASMHFDFPDDLEFAKDKDGDETDFSDWTTTIEEIIRQVADDNYVYPDEVEVDDYNESVRFTFRQSHGGDGWGENDFESFLDSIQEYDGKVEVILEETIEEMREQDVLHSNATEERLAKLKKLNNLKNFNVELKRGRLNLTLKDQYEMTLPIARALGVPDLKRVEPRGPNQKIASSPARDRFIKDTLRVLNLPGSQHTYGVSAFNRTWANWERSTDFSKKQIELPLKTKGEKELNEYTMHIPLGLNRTPAKMSLDDFEVDLENGGTLYSGLSFEDLPLSLFDDGGIEYFIWLDQNLDAFFDVVAKEAISQAQDQQKAYRKADDDPGYGSLSRTYKEPVSENVSYGRLCESWKKWASE